MTSYLTNYLPSFRTSLNSTENVETLNSGEPGQIKYIAIIDTSSEVPGTKDESDAELDKKLIVFVSGDSQVEISSNVKIRLAGLMQGVYAFSSEFIASSKPEEKVKRPMVISAASESFVAIQIEESYSLICSIASNDGIVLKQLQFILNQQHVFFQLFHKSLSTMKEEAGAEVLQNVSSQWWSGFLSKYNQNLTTRNIKWPNMFNYLGFNSIIMEGYKKSSISMSNRVKDEFRKLILEEELIPHGLIVGCFTPATKKLGLIHVQSLKEEVELQSLIDVYRWMEFDYITQTENDESAGHNGDTETVTEEDAMNFLNPMNLTNNLVVSPWNKMSNMIRSGSVTDATNASENSSQTNSTSVRPWLSMANVFGTSSEPSNSTNEVVSDSDDRQESLNSGEDVFGRFLHGMQRDRSILRKLVYLPSKKDDSDVATNKSSLESEYQLVTYFHDDIYITLVYDSSDTTRLDDAQFYSHLASTILEPLREEVVQYQASTLGTSTTSMNTLNLATIDGNFLYTVFDFKHMHYTSSIPLVLYQNDDKYPTIVNIHDQLIKISENFDFTAHEFYHKFTLGNKHDWMSYIIKYGTKLIVIIKNNSKNNGYANGGGGGGGGTIPPEDRTMVNQIAGLVSDYASLGFLENLGDDVKYWLGQVIDTE
ncbi:CCZ1 [Candida margitis]|uniref:CCZ1 n=1 Tax=Candida margitis TaxID=1775924 RepID=UPI002227DDE1|nr:CCZ1 [Candida margitis]KAI5952222.1 CCZ1 [Candida margitis]